MTSPYLLLSLPRSGSNFYSSIINSTPGTRIHIEPLSMHTGTALDDDLLEHSETRRKFQCRCGKCHVCCLRKWLNSGASRGFKETTLFSILPAVQTWLPQLKIVFINRPVEQVVRSHVNGQLFDRWHLASRPYVQKTYPRPIADGDKVEILKDLQNARLEFWKKYEPMFDVLNLEYSDILKADTAELCFERIAEFLGLGSSAPMMNAWIRRRSLSNANMNSIYSTFGRRELTHV